MAKATVTRLFVGAIVAIVAGAVLALAAVVAALAGGAVALGGPGVVEVNGGAVSWSLLGIAIGCLSIAGGAIAGVVSWIGALSNVARLEDKTWFVVLLALGLVSLGFVAMVAYVLAGPDGTRRASAPRGIATTTGA